MPSDERDATEFGMDISKANAEQLQAAGRKSQDKRKKGGEESLRIPNDKEEKLISDAAKQSQDKRNDK